VLGERNVYFRVSGDLRTYPTTYYDRTRLRAGASIEGPAIIFQVDSTTVVPPGWTFRKDAGGSLLLAKKSSKRARRRVPNGNGSH
jgi:N-methylhydantoinase A